MAQLCEKIVNLQKLATVATVILAASDDVTLAAATAESDCIVEIVTLTHKKYNKIIIIIIITIKQQHTKANKKLSHDIKCYNIYKTTTLRESNVSAPQNSNNIVQFTSIDTEITAGRV